MSYSKVTLITVVWVSFEPGSLRSAVQVFVESAVAVEAQLALSPSRGGTGMLIRRQLSTTEKIAAMRGPASWLPIWIQLERPRAMGRIEFSARLLLSSKFWIIQKTCKPVQIESG
jgi:hypothetical protein